MPLPLILGAAAAVAGVTGVGAGIHGGVKLKKANDAMKYANEHHEQNMARFEKRNIETSETLDSLGKFELEILKSFEDFSKVFEKIQNRPEFKEYHKDGVTIPKYNGEELKQVSVGAGVLIGGLGGATVGTAGGFAAAGATTAAVMALGCASTGTPIAALSGAAATNATLAALGGGAIAAGGGGMALGTTILGASTLGVGLLVGGVIFNITGGALSHKAEEAQKQVNMESDEVSRIVAYMRELAFAAKYYQGTLKQVNSVYQDHLSYLKGIVYAGHKTNWNDFTENEKRATENAVLLTGLLYNMCKVKLVLQSETEGELNRVNHEEINRSAEDAEKFLDEKGFRAPA